MSDIELAVKSAQRLEALLVERLGASGKGLHEKLSSVQDRLPRELIRRIRWIATVRNRVVHEAAAIDDRAGFELATRQATRELSAMQTTKARAAEARPRRRAASRRSRPRRPARRIRRAAWIAALFAVITGASLAAWVSLGGSWP